MRVVGPSLHARPDPRHGGNFMLKVKVPGGFGGLTQRGSGAPLQRIPAGPARSPPVTVGSPSFTGSAEAPLAFRRADEVGNSPHGSDAEGAAVGLPTAEVGRTLMYVYVDAAANVAAG